MSLLNQIILTEGYTMQNAAGKTVRVQVGATSPLGVPVGAVLPVEKMGEERVMLLVKYGNVIQKRDVKKIKKQFLKMHNTTSR